MSEAVTARGSASFAERALNRAGAFWLSMALLGQWAFFYYIAAFYGPSVISGEHETWNRLAVIGRTPYVAGDRAGNLAYAAHALAAGLIAFGGALQLIPWVRARAPRFHRWNGRVFLFTVTGLSLSGFYLVWVRGTSPSFVDAVATTINGVLILTFSALAYGTARARRFAVHRRWAMRLYLASNAQWFIRVGMFGYFIVVKVLGGEPSMDDPFAQFWKFGCFLVPLGVLELYLRAQDSDDPRRRLAVAGGLFALTLVMGVGMVAFIGFSQALITGAPLSLK